MKTNVKTKEKARTHGGGFATVDNPKTELRRTVSSCLLWENLFYEGATSVANRITNLCSQVGAEYISDLAVTARHDLNLRHVPLWLCVHLLKKKGFKSSDTIAKVVSRPDEMGELISLYWRVNGAGASLAAQLKKGLARAFTKFSEYQLAKWNRDAEVSLKDVMFLCHPKPADDAQQAIWQRLIDDKLETPDTWEVELSASRDKKASWTRLLEKNRLGGMALLSNLRNIKQAGIDNGLIKQALDKANFNKILPFRFISAARAVPGIEHLLEEPMLRSMANFTKLNGKTLVVVDISGSMESRLSGKSDMNRMDAGLALAILLRELCEDSVVYATAGCDSRSKHATTRVPSRRGFALADVIKSQRSKIGGGGIFLTQCMDFIQKDSNEEFDRVIVITDEQDCERDNDRAASKANTLCDNPYILDIGAYDKGIASNGKWTRICGFSSRIVDWILDTESTNNEQRSQIQ